MMAQIERKAAANTARIDLARANALFALDAALNQLQREAGPDQRITARAEILDGDPATDAVDGVAQPFWTGVWKSGPAGLDKVNTGTPQRQTTFGSLSPDATQKVASAAWLVSGDPAGLSPLTFSGTTNGVSATAVTLARNWGGGGTNVIVPLVKMTGGASTNGAYGYWVSDEGVKARINQCDVTLGVSPQSDIPGSVAHNFAVQSAAGFKASPLLAASDTRADTNVVRVLTMAGMSNLANLSGAGGTNVPVLRAHFTTASRGVFADVRRGGLRKDLTAALESSTAYAALTSAYGYGADMLYRSASSADLTIPAIDTGVNPPLDGVSWMNLYGFYNSYKASMVSPVTASGNPLPVAPRGAGAPDNFPQQQSPRIYSLLLGGQTTKLGGMVPVPVAYRVDIALSSYFSAGVWKLRLHYYPQLVVWNPYAARLVYTDYQFRRDIGAFATAGTPVSATIKVGGNTMTPLQLNPVASGRLPLQTRLGDCATLEPGETRVFALDQDSAKASVTEAVTFGDLVSTPAMSADFSQYCDVPGFTGTATGADLVTVTLSDRRLRCQNVDTFILPTQLKWPRNDGAPTSSAGTRYLGGGNWDIAAASAAWSSNLQIQQMNGLQRRVIGFYIRQKGIRPTSSAYVYSNANNQIPIFMGNAGSLSPVDDSFSFAWQEVYLSPLGSLYQNGQTDIQVIPSSDGAHWETSFGLDSAGAGAPGGRFVLRDVPTLPMVSLGQFMHMPAAGFWSIGAYQTFCPGSMFVGGSLASPIIRRIARPSRPAWEQSAEAGRIPSCSSTTASWPTKLCLTGSFSPPCRRRRFRPPAQLFRPPGCSLTQPIPARSLPTRPSRC